MDKNEGTFSYKKVGFSLSLPEGWVIHPRNKHLFSANFTSRGISLVKLTVLVDEAIPFIEHHIRITSLQKFPKRVFQFSQGKLSNIQELSIKRASFGGIALNESIWAGKRDGIAKIFHTITMPLERAIVQLYFEFPASLYNKPDDVINSVLQGVVIHPAPKQSSEQLAKTYKKIGEIYTSQGLWKEAASVFTQALSEQPNDPVLYVLLGESYFQAKSFDQALEAFTKATMLTTQNAKAYKGLGKTHFSKKSFDKGISAIKRALILSEDEAPLYLLLGNAYLKQGKTEAAIRSYQKLLRLKEMETEGHLGIGKAYLATDLYEQAIFEFNEVLRRQPQHREPHCLLEKAYTQLNAMENAEKEKALCTRGRATPS